MTSDDERVVRLIRDARREPAHSLLPRFAVGLTLPDGESDILYVHAIDQVDAAERVKMIASNMAFDITIEYVRPV